MILCNAGITMALSVQACVRRDVRVTSPRHPMRAAAMKKQFINHHLQTWAHTHQEAGDVRCGKAHRSHDACQATCTGCQSNGFVDRRRGGDRKQGGCQPCARTVWPAERSLCLAELRISSELDTVLYQGNLCDV